jgi:peptidoglycan/xylan/chitin deacetylase (PgdA/CDA1 family)
MAALRKLVFMLLYTGRVHELFRYFNRNKLTILLYHGVAPAKTQGIYNYLGKHVSPDAFRAHLTYIAQRYTVLSLDDALRRLKERTLPCYALAITFDDGYQNLYSHAFPLLKEFGIPATIFIATDFVLQKRPLWVDRLEYALGQKEGARAELVAEDMQLRSELKALPNTELESRLTAIERQAKVALRNFSGERAVYAPLSETEVKVLQKAGIGIGGHTKTHLSLPHLSDGEAAEEIAGSKLALEEKFGTISQVFCYPYGRWNQKTEQLVIEAGFAGAVTTKEGANPVGIHPFRLQRFSMDGVEDIRRCAAATSGLLLFMRKLILMIKIKE